MATSSSYYGDHPRQMYAQMYPGQMPNYDQLGTATTSTSAGGWALVDGTDNRRAYEAWMQEQQRQMGLGKKEEAKKVETLQDVITREVEKIRA